MEFAALATFPWLELDAPTRTALRDYDGVTATFTTTWVPNPTVSANDLSFCLGGDCSGVTGANAGTERIYHSWLCTSMLARGGYCCTGGR